MGHQEYSARPRYHGFGFASDETVLYATKIPSYMLAKRLEQVRRENPTLIGPGGKLR